MAEKLADDKMFRHLIS